MKLFHSPTSPYVRKVMVVAHLTGLADRLDLTEGSGTPLAPNEGTAYANPVAKVPCLVTDDGLALMDSRVITRYLDVLGEGGLYPQGAALWPVLAREAVADGILDAAILIVYEGRLRPEEKRFSGWTEAQMARIQRALKALDAEAASWEGFDASHVAVACTLGYLDFRFAEAGWRGSYPALSAWFDGVATRPEMIATAPRA
ncbi:MAG: glutathione S-transferase [Pseudomonadota bacterium]